MNKLSLTTENIITCIHNEPSSCQILEGQGRKEKCL